MARRRLRFDAGAAALRNHPAKRGSGLPFTPRPLITKRLPPSGPGSILSVFSPIEVAYITARASPPDITLVTIGTGTSTVRAIEPSGLKHTILPPPAITDHRLPCASTVAPSGTPPIPLIAANCRLLETVPVARS